MTNTITNDERNEILAYARKLHAKGIDYYSAIAGTMARFSISHERAKRAVAKAFRLSRPKR